LIGQSPEASTGFMVIASRSTDGTFNATAPMLFMVKRVAFLRGVFEHGVPGKDADESAALGGGAIYCTP